MSENGFKTTSASKTIAHDFFRTISGAKQTKMKSPSHSPKNAPCEHNLKIATNFTPKTQSQLEKNAVCKRAFNGTFSLRTKRIEIHT